MDRQIDNWRQTNRYRENNNNTSNKTMKKVRGGEQNEKKLHHEKIECAGVETKSPNLSTPMTGTRRGAYGRVIGAGEGNFGPSVVSSQPLTLPDKTTGTRDRPITASASCLPVRRPGACEGLNSSICCF